MAGAGEELEMGNKKNCPSVIQYLFVFFFL
jgi:hypothetical protein